MYFHSSSQKLQSPKCIARIIHKDPEAFIFYTTNGHMHTVLDFTFLDSCKSTSLITSRGRGGAYFQLFRTFLCLSGYFRHFLCADHENPTHFFLPSKLGLENSPLNQKVLNTGLMEKLSKGRLTRCLRHLGVPILEKYYVWLDSTAPQWGGRGKHIV